MKKAILIFQLTNLISLGVLTFFSYQLVFQRLTIAREKWIYPLLILIGINAALRYWVRKVDRTALNPMLRGVALRVMYYAGFLIFLVGAVCEVLNWPNSSLLIVSALSLKWLTFGISWFVKEPSRIKASNHEILDDLEL